MRSLDKRLGRGLPRSSPPMGPLRARGKADRLRGLSPTLAFQPRHDGRAHHRSQAGHRRHVGSRLPQAHVGDRTLSGTLAGAYANVSAIPRDDRLHLLTWGVVRLTAFVDVAQRARSQATIYAARARHSVNAIERLSFIAAE